MAASEIKQKGDSVSVGNEENSTTNVDKEDDVEYTAAKKLLNEILHGLNMPESGLFLKAVLQKYPRLVNFERKTDGTCDGTVLQSVCSHFYGPYSDEELLGMFVLMDFIYLTSFYIITSGAGLAMPIVLNVGYVFVATMCSRN